MKKLLTFTLSTIIAVSALAWEPAKPIEVTIGFAPGSGNELSFRGISSLVLEKHPKINFTVINKPGADGIVAMNEFISKPNDGYHIYVPSHQGIWVTADFFYPTVKKYTLDDFDYGFTLAKSPLAVVANASSNVNNPKELLARIQNDKGEINWAAGSGAHKLAYDYMMSKTSKAGLHQLVSYRGPAQAVADVAGGHIEFGIVPTAVAAPLVKSGKIKFIGLASEKPVAGLENVPLMQSVVPGMNVYAAWAIIFPKNTPADVKDWYTTEFVSAINSPKAAQFLHDNYMIIDKREHTAAGLKTSMESLRKQWHPVLQKITH